MRVLPAVLMRGTPAAVKTMSAASPTPPVPAWTSAQLSRMVGSRPRVALCTVVKTVGQLAAPAKLNPGGFGASLRGVKLSFQTWNGEVKHLSAV